MITRVLLFFFPLCLFASSFVYDLKERYRQIETFEAFFKQKIYISTLKKEREFEGEFFYKKGKGFLWRYKKPKEKVFLFDGRFLWEEEEDRPYVIKKKMKEEKFIDVVGDIKRIDELFEIKREYKAEGKNILEVLPKNEKNIQKNIRLYVGDDLFIDKIEFEEITGNINMIEFFEIKINKGLSDGLFVLNLKGKEVRESP